MRASDADRERIAALLRDNYAAGRLTSDEFNERLDKAYAAKTLGDLNALTTDLPAPDLPASDLSSYPGGAGQPPQPVQPGGPVMGGSGRFSPAWRAAVGSYVSISLVCFVVWLLSGANSNLWFLWPVGIFGAGLIGRWVTGAPPGGYGRQSRHQHRMEYRRQRRGF
jgi:hypothetical protein